MSDANDIPVEVLCRDGRTFSARLGNLTEQSAFVVTDQHLQFKDAIQVQFEGITSNAEIAFVSSAPPGVVVTFDLSTSDPSKLAELVERAPIVGPESEMWGEQTVDTGGVVPATAPSNTQEVPVPAGLPGQLVASADDHATDAPTDAPTDAVAAESPFSDEATPFSNPFASATPTPFGGLTPFPEGLDPNLPLLKDDGTLRFKDADAFQFQFATNITHGGVVAQSSPLPIGSHKILRFTVPGVDESVELSARVGFVGDGTVGFMLDSFAVHRAKLESMVKKVT